MSAPRPLSRDSPITQSSASGTERMAAASSVLMRARAVGSGRKMAGFRPCVDRFGIGDVKALLRP
jgi:hypothetical protein